MDIRTNPDKLRLPRNIRSGNSALFLLWISSRENWKSSKRPSALTRARLEEKKTKPSMLGTKARTGLERARDRPSKIGKKKRKRDENEKEEEALAEGRKREAERGKWEKSQKESPPIVLARALFDFTGYGRTNGARGTNQLCESMHHAGRLICRFHADTLITLIKRPNLGAPLPLHHAFSRARHKQRDGDRDREADSKGRIESPASRCVSSNLLLDQAGIITLLRTGWMLRSDRLPVSPLFPSNTFKLPFWGDRWG